MKYRITLYRDGEKIGAHKDKNLADTHQATAELLIDCMQRLERLIAESKIDQIALVITWEPKL